MKLKKLLSFALALAMVLAFVPALSLTASAAGTGYADGAAWYAFEFDLGTISSAQDFGFVDADGNTFAGACDAWWSGDGFYVADGERSISLSTGFTRKSAQDIGEIKYDTYSGDARVRVLVTLGDNSTYTVTYYTVDDDSTATSFATAEYTGSPNGIAYPTDWNYSSSWNMTGVTASTADWAFQNFTVYSGNDVDNIVYDDTTIECKFVSVVASYCIDSTSNVVTEVLGGAYDSLVTTESYTFDAITNYTANGLNYFYSTPATTLSTSDSILMDAEDNPDVSGYYEGYVFANSGSSTGSYKVVSGNLIPNGDFSVGDDGLDGWYTPALAALQAAYFINNNDGTVTMTYEANTGYDYKRLMRDWAIETDKTYLFTMYEETATTWHKVTLTNTLGSENTNYYIFNGTSSGTNEKIFTNSTPYSYLHLQFRWNNASDIGNFGLYEIEEADLSSYTVTRNYYLPDGAYIDTETSDAVFSGESVSFDEVYYGPDGGNALYYTAAATYDVTGDIEEDITLNALDNNNIGDYQDGYQFIKDGKVYQVNGDNLIPNGDFTYGLEGWYSANNAAATSSYFTVNSDGTLTIISGNGSASAEALKRSWSIEANKTYLFTYWQSNSATGSSGSARWQRTFLNNDSSSTSNNNDAILLGAGTSDVETGESVVYGTNEIVFENSESYAYITYKAAWSAGVTVDNFGLYEVEYVKDATTTSIDYKVGDDTVGTDSVETIDAENQTFAARRFYYSGKIYETEETTVDAGTTGEAVAEAVDVIAPTADGFFTPNSASSLDSVERYTEDDGNSILVSGFSSYDPFGVIALIDSDKISDAEDLTGSASAKTRVGYLEFAVPDGYSASTLTLTSYNSYNVEGSYIAAFPTTVDISSMTEGTATTVNLGIDGLEVYYSDAALTDDAVQTVTINLSGIEAVDGTIKLALVVPKGYIWFADEEKTVLNGTYEGQTAYITYAESKDATITLTDNGEDVGSFTKTVPDGAASVTIPGGIYGGQYYIDSAASITLDNYEGTLPVDEISVFSWNNDAIVYSEKEYGGDKTHNIAVSATWNTGRTAYAYANIPEVTDDTKTLQITVEAYYNNGTWQAPGTITLYSTDYDALKALDLAGGSDTTDALAALTFEEFAELEVDLTDYDDTTRIGTFSVKLNSSNITGNTAFQIFVGGNDNGSIASIRSITFDVVTKDVGVELLDGAQIRIGNAGLTDDKITTDSGIRFIATVDTTNTLAADADEIGIAIWDGGFDAAPTQDLTADPAIYGEPAATQTADKYQDEGIFSLAITDIAEGNFNRIYVAAPYVVVNGETYYGTAVARTPYQVAAGVLTSSTTSVEGYEYSADEETLYAVLNAYANQTGARITLTSGYEVGYATYANGADAFFTYSEPVDNGDGSYTITLTATGSATFYDYADSYYRINNAKETTIEASGIFTSITATPNGNTLEITFTPAE